MLLPHEITALFRGRVACTAGTKNLEHNNKTPENRSEETHGGEKKEDTCQGYETRVQMKLNDSIFSYLQSTSSQEHHDRHGDASLRVRRADQRLVVVEVVSRKLNREFQRLIVRVHYSTQPETLTALFYSIGEPAQHAGI